MTYDLINTIPSEIKTDDIINCSYDGSVKSITLPKGTYRLECWGALGGSYNTTYIGGKGGYSVGIITLTEKLTFYLYAGGQGKAAASSVTGELIGGFNGGGNSNANTSYLACSGGGGSDIRIGTDSLYARVIVAGGGGGAIFSYIYSGSGGNGGGTSGTAGGQYSANLPGGLPGTATTAGTSYYGKNTSNSTTYGTPASFGKGGSANGNYVQVVGGGGGWYGGGYARLATGGGGSGYVYTSSTASNYPSGCLLNNSFYLTEASTAAGQRSGDGYITITALEVSALPVSIKIDSSTWNEDTEMFVKINSTIWKSVDTIYIKTENGWKEGG